MPNMPNGHHGWWLMGLLSLVLGCAHPVPLTCFAPPVLPTVVQGSFPLDLSALPIDTGPYPAHASYLGVTEADCPCLAARASTLGNLLDQKAQASSQSKLMHKMGAQKTGEQTRAVLQYAA